MRAELVDPTSEQVPPEWEKFRHEHGLISAWNAEALTAVAWASQQPLRLGIVRDQGDTVAVVCGNLAGVPRRRGRYATPGRVPAACWYDCRMPIGFTEGFVFSPYLDRSGQAAALSAVRRELRRALGPRLLGVLYRNVGLEHVELLSGFGRKVISTSPNTVLRNEWQSMDDYFASLPRKRRRRFQRLHADIAASPDLTTLTGLRSIDPSQASRLDQLTRMKHARRGEVVVPIPLGYFDKLNGQPDVTYFAHQARDGDRLLSFDLVFEGADVLVATVTGSLDVRAGGRRDLYFDLYLREIEHLIARGIGRIEFGKGMLDLKRRFGCTTIPQHAVIALR